MSRSCHARTLRLRLARREPAEIKWGIISNLERALFSTNDENLFVIKSKRNGNESVITDCSPMRAFNIGI